MQRNFIVVSRTARVLLMGFTLAGCVGIFKNPPPLPPLLDKASAGSGYTSACPASNESERRLIAISGLATSPQVNMRLEQEFPAGTDAALLNKYLVDQGFTLQAPCETDTNIQHASFFRKGVGLLPYDTRAEVYWKIDAKQRIVWAKGFLMFSGL